MSGEPLDASGPVPELGSRQPVPPAAPPPATAPAAPAPAEVEWHRLHPLSPLLRGGLFLLVVAGIVIANLRDRVFEFFFAQELGDVMGPDESDLIDYLLARRLLIWALVAVLVAILIIVAFSCLSWRFSTFRITADAVESRRGVLFRQHRRAPLERIQSVNLQRSLLARVLGLTQLDVQTAGQGGKVALQYFGHRDAKLVREQILLAARASKGAPPANPAMPANAAHPAAPAAPVNPAALTNPAAPALPPGGMPSQAPLAVDFSGQAYTVTPGVLDSRIRDLADFDIDPSAREAGMLIKVPVSRLIASILLSTEMLVVILIVAAIAVTSIWTTPFALAGLFPVLLGFASLLIAQFNKGFNFVLSRAEDGVRIGAGLTATSTETIPFGRVHAVEARQPLGWRPLGWWKVRITTAGHSVAQGGQNKMQNTVLPVGELDDVLRVFETLLYPGDDEAAARRVALQDALVGEGQGYLRAGSRAGLLLWFGTRRAGVRIEDPRGAQPSLRIRRGWLTRSLSVMPIVRAQSIQLSRPLVHYLLGLASVQAHTVLGPVRMQMRGIDLEQAKRCFDELAETVVRVQGLDAAGRAGGGVAGAASSSSCACCGERTTSSSCAEGAERTESQDPHQ